MENKDSIPMELVQLEDGFHLMINAEINDYNVRMLIDTGASLTCLDSERILNIPGITEDDIELLDNNGTGLGTNTMESAFTCLGEFCINDFCLYEYPVVVINMNHINKSYSQLGIDPIDGVIGSDYLLLFKAIIDYSKMRLTLTEPDVYKD